jgi:hypothetical protein
VRPYKYTYSSCGCMHCCNIMKHSDFIFKYVGHTEPRSAWNCSEYPIN